MMIRFKNTKRTVLFLLILWCFFGVGEAFADSDLSGRWAFSYDPAVTVLTLEKDGSALYDDTACTWNLADSELLLTDESGRQLSLHFEPVEEGITLWIPAVFERTAGEEGIIGSWKAIGKSQSSFIFASNGRFLEDNVFTGTYLVDETAGQITLHYISNFEDTVICYSFRDQNLIVAYPWVMIRQ